MAKQGLKRGGRRGGRGGGRRWGGQQHGTGRKADRDPAAELVARFKDRPTDGLVTCMYGSHADVTFPAEGDRVRFCLLAPKVHRYQGLCVGDRVWTKQGATADERIVGARSPRQTELRRKRGEDDRTGHVIAANVEQMAIVFALHEPPLRTGAIDRYLVLASALGLTPLLVPTKTDLSPVDDPGWGVLQPYRELEIPILATSSESATGLDALREALAGRLTVFAGHSGVGKSRLCQALDLAGAPIEGELSRSGGRVRGRHTTSVAQLLRLPEGGWLVDTPGVRAVGLVDIEPRDVGIHFPELAEVGQACAFEDCLHVDEDDCAVRDAVGQTIPEARYESYVRLIRSMQEEA